MIKIGINGFGRIGRAIFRINEYNSHFEIKVINDIDPLVENHVYLANYDSIYGTLKNKVSISSDENYIKYKDQEIVFYSKGNIDEVPWSEHDVDVVIDSSGIYENVVRSHNLIKQRVKKVIVTYSPKNSVDHTIINSVNETSYDTSRHNIISSSICDANACAPVLKVLDEKFSVVDGFITTLHPWLGYQNLLDSSLKSVSSPGHYWSDFALGRSSTDSLIPKPTSLVSALRQVLPNSTKNITAMSMRVPTSIVSASDMVLSLDKQITVKNIEDAFALLEENYPDVVKVNRESLVSIDFKGIRQSCVIDLRWLKITNNKLKLLIWYDNEWSYSSRVIDLLEIINE